MRVLPFKINITKIESNLYLGSIEDAYDQKKLSGLGITHILNMATEIPNFHEPNFEYKKINGRDVPTFQMHRHFDDVADFIHNAMSTGKVFVHCFCGISRSTTAILAFFIKYRGIDPRKGYESIRKKRWIVYPNDGFMKQLLEFYKSKSVENGDFSARPSRISVSKGNLTVNRTETNKLPSIATVGTDKAKVSLSNSRGVSRSLNKENQWSVTGKLVAGRSASKTLKPRTETRLNCFKY